MLLFGILIVRNKTWRWMCAPILPCCEHLTLRAPRRWLLFVLTVWRDVEDCFLFVILKKVIRQNWWLFTIQATSSFEGHLKHPLSCLGFGQISFEGHLKHPTSCLGFGQISGLPDDCCLWIYVPPLKCVGQVVSAPHMVCPVFSHAEKLRKHQVLNCP